MKKEEGRRKKGVKMIMRISLFNVLMLLSPFSLLLTPSTAFAAAPTEDITSSNFKIVVCDGPKLPATVPTPNGYVVCDFQAAMTQVQHLINIFIVVGVLVAVFGFCYAGFLYVVHGSESGKRAEANKIFMNVFWGFIIMLTAWFIVYQIIAWLQCGPSSTNCESPGSALLGKPNGSK